MSPAERAARFAALHESGCFVLPNAWDAGSARVLAAAGAVAPDFMRGEEPAPAIEERRRGGSVVDRALMLLSKQGR